MAWFKGILSTGKKDQSRNLKILAYAGFFIFGLKLLLSPILFFGEVVQQFGLFFGIQHVLLSILLLFCCYNLLKKKKWALHTIVVVLGLTVISKLFLMSTGEGVKPPITDLAWFLIFLSGYRYFK